MRRGVRRGLLLLATANIMASGAFAQELDQPARPAQVPPGAVVQRLGPDAAAPLRSYLTTLADNPRNLDALLGAGREALRMGDAEASLGFYARADEVSPRNARVKAGMASAFVQLGQPQAALRLFEEAASLGAPAAEFAADRGLAFDMSGDPARAQQEYVLAMRFRDEPELRRRMALSLAITGQRDAALRLIDAQLRSHDRAAWRTQAFVLALTGDAAGANHTAHNVLPAGTAQAMAPFLAQLSHLSPAQKAMAVHFGQFPNNGGARVATAPVTADPGALAFAMGGTPAATAPATRPAGASSRNSRRRAAQARDSSDPFRLREPGRSGRRSTQTASRQAPAAPAQPPAAAPPVPAASPPPRTEQRPVEVAGVNSRWSSPAQSPPVVPPPSPPPAPAYQSQPQLLPVAPRPQQPSVTALPRPSPVTTQASASPPSQQAAPPPSAPTGISTNTTNLSASISSTSGPARPAAPPPSAPTRITSSAMAPPVTIPSASAPVQPLLPSAPSSAPVPIQSPPAIAAVNPSDEPPVQTSSPPAVGPAVGSTAEPGFSIEPPAPPPAPAVQGAETRFADIAALVNSLPPEERIAPATPPTPAAPPPRRTESARTAQNRPAAPHANARQRPAQPAHPSRHWVQIAGGANRAALPREFTRLRTLAPQQLGRRDAYTATARATNRLLVGPFASDRAAQEFVNQLAGHNVSAFAWTSDAGQEIQRLQTR